MASSLITGAIMLVLLLVAGYVIVNGIMNTGEKLSNAQYDTSADMAKYLGTDIRLNNTYRIYNNYLWFDVINTGRVPVTYPLDLIVIDEVTHTPTYYSNTERTEEFIAGAWPLTTNTLNKGVLDPGEGVGIGILVPEHKPYWAEVITSNGISSSAYILYNLTP